MIISGSESAVTDIMKASTVPSAAPLPINASTTGRMPAAFEYIGMPITTAAGTDHQASRPMIVSQHLGRHVAVNEGTHRDAGDDPHPDLADDLAHGFDAGLDAVNGADLLLRQLDSTRAQIADPVFEPAFELQLADDEAADDRDGEPEGEVGERHLPADQTRTAAPAPPR